MKRTLSMVLAWGILAAAAATAAADVKLPGVFGDHMVLQRDAALPVWGAADPAEKVTVSLDGQSQTTQADTSGKWSVALSPVKAGGPYVLQVQGKNTVQFSDVLVGEVWLCSGQSNMQMTVSEVRNKDAEIAAANHPRIRMLGVARKTAEEPQTSSGGEWRVCSPKTVAGFSAAAYFFGRRLHKELQVPVGLIDSSWGGTPIQGWTSQQAQQATPELAGFVKGMQRAIETWNPAAAKQRYTAQLQQWKNDAAAAKAAGKSFKTRQPRKPEDPRIAPGSPGRLYNGMIAPLAPYAIRGAIWYQGEANAGGGAALYGLQLRTMIANWRAIWHEGDFPFIYVQLPNFMAPQQQPSETAGWPILREQMLKTLAFPGAGMAVTIDIGEADNIHPKNKQEAGNRLAQWALAKTYGKHIVPGGPLYKSMHKEGAKIVVEFDDVGDGLAAKDGGKLEGFAIAGGDKNFVWADATIEGRTVVVSSPAVQDPVAVRYAWANNPKCNLYNQAQLPASPFRTDDWAK
jgi:sialate O-acetylesterase